MSLVDALKVVRLQRKERKTRLSTALAVVSLGSVRRWLSSLRTHRKKANVKVVVEDVGQEEATKKVGH